MLQFEQGHYVYIREMADGPLPRPLASGFNAQTGYRVLGLHTARPRKPRKLF